MSFTSNHGVFLIRTTTQRSIPCVVRVSMRARRMRLSIAPDGQVTLTKPYGTSQDAAVRFIEQHRPWILRHTASILQRPEMPWSRHTAVDYRAHAKHALVLTQERIRYFNRWYGFNVGSIRIRNQRSRWGSCSRHGTLSFNYRIAFLPSELQDYLIVHELCHLGAMNHSDRFWKLVARTIPDYKRRRALLRTYSLI